MPVPCRPVLHIVDQSTEYIYRSSFRIRYCYRPSIKLEVDEDITRQSPAAECSKLLISRLSTSSDVPPGSPTATDTALSWRLMRTSHASPLPPSAANC